MHMRALGLGVGLFAVVAWGAEKPLPEPRPGPDTAAALAALPASGPGRAPAVLSLLGLLEAQHLPVSASTYAAELFKAGPEAQGYSTAVEALVAEQAELGDEYLIPSLLDAQQHPSWNGLPTTTRARLDVLLAGIEHRKGRHQEALAHLDAVSKASPVYAKARYLSAVVLSDPELPGGPGNEEALARFREVMALGDKSQEELENTRLLSQLGAARSLYALGRYDESVRAYDSVPRFSSYWDEALFEGGYARFRAGDLGGALGSLKSLQAPQFEGSFLPESRLLESTIYFFSCLFAESKGALAELDRVYAPMLEQLKPLIQDDSPQALERASLWTNESDRTLPLPVRVWITHNARLQGLDRVRRRTELERKRLSELAPSPGRDALLQALEETEQTLKKVHGQWVHNRVQEAYRNLKSFSDQAEILRFETKKAEKELVEAGVDQQALLAAQSLHRPRMPGGAWEYWKLEDEFWIDELGYYQYTLKNGCPTHGRPTGR
jgi:tetratricopeptide (TPR) repeat protein